MESRGINRIFTDPNYVGLCELVERQFGVSHKEALDLTVRDIMEMSAKIKEDTIRERMNDSKFLRMVQLLMGDSYDYLYENLGESFIRAICSVSKDSVIEWTHSKPLLGDYDSEEGKNLLTREKSYSYRSWDRTEYAVLKNSYGDDDILSNAIAMRFPSLKVYVPEVRKDWSCDYRGSGVTKKTIVVFHMKKVPAPKEQDEEDDDSGIYSSPEFRCSIGAFFTADIDAMIEDYLDYKDLFLEEAGSERYRSIDAFMSSAEMSEFMDAIRHIGSEKRACA